MLLFCVETSLAAKKHFRNATWGMSLADVKASENFQLAIPAGGILTPNSVVYDGWVMGQPVLITYVFAHDRLVRGKYLLKLDDTFYDMHIDAYDEFKDDLEKKYGPPDQDKILWDKDHDLGEFSSRFGEAVSLGILKYFAQWNTRATTITMALYGRIGHVALQIEYASTKLKKFEEEYNELREYPGLFPELYLDRLLDKYPD